MGERSQARPWRRPEELVEIGFCCVRVVMMNERTIAISLSGYNGNMSYYGKDTC